MTTKTEAVWAEPLPAGTSAQRAELIVLAKALELGQGRKVNIYTDSWYAFATAHIHGAIYKEQGLLTAEGKTIKNKDEILALLQAIWLPTKVAIMHCPSHQKGTGPVSQGNNLADQTAQQVALQADPILVCALPDPGSPQLPQQPNYSKEDLTWIRTLPGKQMVEQDAHTWEPAECRTWYNMPKLESKTVEKK